MCILFAIVTLFALIKADQVSFITRCKSDDDACLKKSTLAALPVFAGGLPEFGVNSMDPLFFKRVDLSTPVLNFFIDDITVKGFKKCIPVMAHRDSKISKICIKILCDGGRIDGRYMMVGQLLQVAIEGNGKVHVDLKNGELEFNMFTNNIQGKDGKNHWNVKNWTYNIDLKGKSIVYFENLFKKDSLLAQTAQEMVASNGNEIIYSIGRPLITAIMTDIVENIQNFFHAVPSEELSLD